MKDECCVIYKLWTTNYNLTSLLLSLLIFLRLYNFTTYFSTKFHFWLLSSIMKVMVVGLSVVSIWISSRTSLQGFHLSKEIILLCSILDTTSIIWFNESMSCKNLRKVRAFYTSIFPHSESACGSIFRINHLTTYVLF